MNVAIIMAREGSKRIPLKNIKKFCGKPIISYPIEVAKKSKIFDEIIVSTDSKLIADLSKKLGVSAPFLRPKKLSDDFSTTNDVMHHSVSWMLSKNYDVKNICCMYATSAFATIDDLTKGFKKINRTKWKYAFSATDFGYPIHRSMKIQKNGGVKMFFQENLKARSQDLENAIHDAAQFYWASSNTWLEKVEIFGSKSCPIMIPRWRTQDMDTQDDWQRAELIYKQISN